MVTGGRGMDGLLGVVPVGEVTRTVVRESDQANYDTGAADEHSELVTNEHCLGDQVYAHYDCA